MSRANPHSILSIPAAPPKLPVPRDLSIAMPYEFARAFRAMRQPPHDYADRSLLVQRDTSPPLEAALLPFWETEVGVGARRVQALRIAYSAVRGEFDEIYTFVKCFGLSAATPEGQEQIELLVYINEILLALLAVSAMRKYPQFRADIEAVARLYDSMWEEVVGENYVFSSLKSRLLFTVYHVMRVLSMEGTKHSGPQLPPSVARPVSTHRIPKKAGPAIAPSVAERPSLREVVAREPMRVFVPEPAAAPLPDDRRCPFVVPPTPTNTRVQEAIAARKSAVPTEPSLDEASFVRRSSRAIRPVVRFGIDDFVPTAPVKRAKHT